MILEVLQNKLAFFRSQKAPFLPECHLDIEDFNHRQQIRR